MYLLCVKANFAEEIIHALLPSPFVFSGIHVLQREMMLSQYTRPHISVYIEDNVLICRRVTGAYLSIFLMIQSLVFSPWPGRV